MTAVRAPRRVRVRSDRMDSFGWTIDGGAGRNGDGIADVIVRAYSPVSGLLAHDGGHVYSGKDGYVLWERVRDPIRVRKWRDRNR